jgi:hypothetical protein
MTDLIIKIVRHTGPSSSARGTVDTSHRYVQNASGGSETRRVEGGKESGAPNRARYGASASAENGPWPFPADPSLFGVEKIVGCEIEPAESESTTRDAIDADGGGRRFGGAQRSEDRLEDMIDVDGQGGRFGGAQRSEASVEDEIDVDGHGRSFAEV